MIILILYDPKRSSVDFKELDNMLYKNLAKIALDVKLREASIEVYKNMDWLPFHLTRKLHLSAYMYRIINENCPQHFIEKFVYISGGTRDGDNFNLYTQKVKIAQRIFFKFRC